MKHPTMIQRSNTITIKSVFLGESKVGKTSLCSRYAKGEWDSNSAPTIAATCFNKDIVVDDTKIKFYIWDTAGQEQFRTISPIYYRSSHVAILVIDLTSLPTIEVARFWVNELRTNGPPGVPIVVIGNKSDLKMMEKISPEDAKTFADSIGATFFRCSALTGENVNAAFEFAAKIALDFYRSQRELQTQYGQVNLVSPTFQKKEEDEKGCSAC